MFENKPKTGVVYTFTCFIYINKTQKNHLSEKIIPPFFLYETTRIGYLNSNPVLLLIFFWGVFKIDLY